MKKIYRTPQANIIEYATDDVMDSVIIPSTTTDENESWDSEEYEYRDAWANIWSEMQEPGL